DPTTMATVSWWPAAPVCPNLNGGYKTASDKQRVEGRIGQYLPGSSPQRLVMPREMYCPAQCTVTKRVVSSTSWTGVTTITDVQRAICTDDYIAVGSYNMQNEIRYVTAAEADANPLPFPVTYDQYQLYKSLGYPCSLDYSTEQ